MVDGVCCCLVAESGAAYATMKPDSEAHPLEQCKHYLSAVPLNAEAGESITCTHGFYRKLGVALMGTVMDGNCRSDTASQIL